MANLQKGVLDKIDHFLEKKKISYEVIISDDGSTDGSKDFIKHFLREHSYFYLRENQHQGKAGAVTSGMLHASGRYILFTDMDQATPIEEVDKLLPYVQGEYDIAIGSRDSKRKGAPWTRVIMARGNILLRKLLIGMGDISDTQCGFKLFRQDVAKTLFSTLLKMHHGFHTLSGSNVSAGFDIELLYLAEQMGYKIKEVPIEWLHVETRRVSPIHDSITGIMDLLRIKKNALEGRYNKI